MCTVAQQVYETREEDRGNKSECNPVQLTNKGQKRDEGQREPSKMRWKYTGIGSAVVTQRRYGSVNRKSN